MLWLLLTARVHIGKILFVCFSEKGLGEMIFLQLGISRIDVSSFSLPVPTNLERSPRIVLQPQAPLQLTLDKLSSVFPLGQDSATTGLKRDMSRPL